MPGFRRRSDADSKLKHIRRNVRPTSDWLRKAGHDLDLREALGFAPLETLNKQLALMLAADPARLHNTGAVTSPEERGPSGSAV